MTSVQSTGTGAPPPAAFKIGTPPTYFTITTTATYTGPITVRTSYNAASFADETKLWLFHNYGTGWVDVTTSLDTTQNIICGTVTSFSPFAVFESTYSAQVQQPINADGTSVFPANRGAIPVKFKLFLNGTVTCQLPPATIQVARTAGSTIGNVNEGDYLLSSDSGSIFRIDSGACQYVYNIAATSLGVGTYKVGMKVNGVPVGNAVFALK